METARKVPLTDDITYNAAALLIQFCRGASQTGFSFEMGNDSRFCRHFCQLSLSYVNLHICLPAKVKALAVQ